jgi:hypothetical protein
MALSAFVKQDYGWEHAVCISFLVIALTLMLDRLFRLNAKAENIANLSTSNKGTGSLSLGKDGMLRDATPKNPIIEGVAVPYVNYGTNEQDFPIQFDNDMAFGFFKELHKPTYDTKLMKSGDYYFGEYFLPKKRLWESRLQLQFKHDVPRIEDIRFGIACEDYVPMNSSVKATQAVVTKMLRQVVGNQVHHSPGDDPKKVKGELENPIFAMPFFAFDQYIVTPPGEEPPDICDPDIQHMGSKRFGRIAEYKRELAYLQFEVGATYTLCFWGISQYLDKLKWEIRGIPVVTPLPISKFCGQPPLHILLYTLKDPESSETRHLPSRRNVIFDLAFWPSKERPSPERLNQLIPTSEQESTMELRKAKKKKKGGQCVARRGEAVEA